MIKVEPLDDCDLKIFFPSCSIFYLYFLSADLSYTYCTCICHVCSSFIHLSFYSFKFFSDLKIQPHFLWVSLLVPQKKKWKQRNFSGQSQDIQTLKSSNGGGNQSELDSKFIIWLNLWVGKIKQIVYSDWLCEHNCLLWSDKEKKFSWPYAGFLPFFQQNIRDFLVQKRALSNFTLKVLLCLLLILCSSS